MAAYSRLWSNAVQDLDSGKLAYRVPEAARAIGVSEPQIWKLLNRMEIRSVKSGHCRLILKRDLEAYLAGLKVAS